MMSRFFICIAMMVTLAACTGGDRGLRDLRAAGGGPDEFRVLPAAPLIRPTEGATLPAPTPGAGNIADPTPVADAITVLGGNANALIPNGAPASDGALINAAGRNGVEPTIRQTLATEDERFRTRRSRFGWLRGRDRYFQAYSGQALDAYGELERFRDAGVATPSAPPPGLR